MKLHQIILENKTPTEVEKIFVIREYIQRMKGDYISINREDNDQDLIEQCYLIAKEWFTENIDKI